MTEELNLLKEKINNCRDCDLYKTRNKIVLGEGNPLSPFMVIGEAPGANEDMAGRPFIGKAGKFFDECLAICGLNRKKIFITNIMKCRPCIIDGKTNKNRPPKPFETEICNKWLKEQISLIKPKIILTLGAPSTKFILGKKSVKMNEIRGHFFESSYCDLVMPSLHPSYILTYKGDLEKEMLIADIKSCVDKLKEIGVELIEGDIWTEKEYNLFEN